MVATVGAAERVAATIRAPLIRARAIADAVLAAAITDDTGTADRLTTELRDCVLRAPNPDAACDVVLTLAAMLIRRRRKA